MSLRALLYVTIHFVGAFLLILGLLYIRLFDELAIFSYTIGLLMYIMTETKR